MNCKCADINELDGAEAEIYARDHLKKIHVNGDTWQIEYACPETGVRWLMDFPYGEYHGGGPARLRKMTNSTETR